MRSVLQTQLPAFSRCMTEKMLTYSLGRGLGPYDRRTVDELTGKWAEAGYPFQPLLDEGIKYGFFYAVEGRFDAAAERIFNVAPEGHWAFRK